MFKPEYVTLVLNAVQNLTISKIWLRNPTKHDAVYYVTCREQGSVEDYSSKTRRRLNERVIDQKGRDKKSHLYKHSQESNHPCVTLSDFKIMVALFKIKSSKEKLPSLC